MPQDSNQGITARLKKLGRLSVKTKILISSLTLAVIPVLVSNMFLGERAIHDSTVIATSQANQLLSALRDTKNAQLIDYLNSLKKQLSAVAASSGTIQATNDFSKTVLDFGDIDPPSERELAGYSKAVRNYFTGDYSKAYSSLNAGEQVDIEKIMPKADVDTAFTWLQYRYVKLNPNKVGEKKKMLRNMLDQLPYDDHHARYHPGFSKLIEELDFRDLYLINIKSDRVVYSVNKGADYAMRLSGTQLEKTSIGKLYNRIKNNPDTAFAVEDFNDYIPDFHRLSGFAGVPIYETIKKNNTLTNIEKNDFYGKRLIGVLIVQFSDAVITNLLTNQQNWAGVGLGKTGEVYLANQNKKAASDLRPFLENADSFDKAMKLRGLTDDDIDRMKSNGSSAGAVEVHAKSVDLALSGKQGVIEEKNYLGQPVLTAYSLLNAYGLKWAILAQMGTKEALAPVQDMDEAITKTSWTVAAVVIVIAIMLAIFFARLITAPLESIEGTVRRLNKGQFEARCRITTGDEYQSLGDAIDTMVDERAQFLRSEEASKLLNKHIIKVLEAVSELSERNLTVNVPVTEDIIGPVADALNLMTEEISDMIRHVRKISDDVGTSSETLSHLAEDVDVLSKEERGELEKMVARLSDASHSLSEISEVATHSNNVAQKARDHVQQAHDTVKHAASGMHDIREVIHETEKRIKRLGERSQEISGITDIINTIAERTHVLSINASMQAAAAGEAGRGFSVVADEVQRLAESSRNATAQIATLVKNIQVETLDASETMSRTIEQVIAGTKLADEAGRIMQQSDEITAQLAETMHTIAKQSTDQANLGLELRKDAEGLRSKSEQTTSKIQAQNRETDQLTNFASQLQKSIATFKLG